MKKILCALLVVLFILTMLPEGSGGWKLKAKADELPVVQIAAGSSSSFALFADGSLYGWGKL